MKEITNEFIISRIKKYHFYLKNVSMSIKKSTITYNPETDFYLVSGSYSYFYRDDDGTFKKAYKDFDFPVTGKEVKDA